MNNQTQIEKIAQHIKDVITKEIAALQTICMHVDASYQKAIQTMLDMRGKVVVLGVGKSGIIANKIAATMVSTGTPAVSLHPTDAVHGDIGIVAKGDVILAISKSGESEELLAMLPALKKIGVTIIALTAEKKSTLAHKANIVLWMPIKQEACPHNLAPTTSTTAALAIGDALAITLMKLHNFKPEDFALFHPGGLLGKRLLLQVADIMRGGAHNPVVRINDSVEKMLLEITQKRAGAVSVVDDKGKLCGLVTDYDIRQVIEQKKDLFTVPIAAMMNKQPRFVFSDEKVADTLGIMENKKRPFSMIPVLDRKTKKVVGMLHIHDILSEGMKKIH